MRIKILLCDDIEYIRDFFSRLLGEQEDMEVVATLKSGQDVREYFAIPSIIPDIVLMDIQMEDEKAGIEAAQFIHERYPKIKILMLTIHENDDLLIEAYLAGAVDYLVKDSTKDTICETIRNAYQNDDFIGTLIREKTRERLDKSKLMETSMVFFINKLSKLTNSEWCVLEKLYNGMSRKKIAETEVLSEDTIKLHVRHILRKLDFATSRELIAYLKKIHFLDYFQWESRNG